MKFDKIALSKELSYALRHAPEKYGLQLDEQGWVPLVTLLNALKKQAKYAALTVQDIADAIGASEKKRHEIDGGRIRAMYGHSTEEKIVKDEAQPPAILYHGTARRFVQSIFTQGLVSKSRQYVHLSEDAETAFAVGSRRDESPVVLQIDAAAAWGEGIRFYHGNETIWLADMVPGKYIKIHS